MIDMHVNMIVGLLELTVHAYLGKRQCTLVERISDECFLCIHSWTKRRFRCSSILLNECFTEMWRLLLKFTHCP